MDIKILNAIKLVTKCGQEMGDAVRMAAEAQKTGMKRLLDSWRSHLKKSQNLTHRAIIILVAVTMFIVINAVK